MQYKYFFSHQMVRKVTSSTLEKSDSDQMFFYARKANVSMHYFINRVFFAPRARDTSFGFPNVGEDDKVLLNHLVSNNMLPKLCCGCL